MALYVSRNVNDYPHVKYICISFYAVVCKIVWKSGKKIVNELKEPTVEF